MYANFARLSFVSHIKPDVADCLGNRSKRNELGALSCLFKWLCPIGGWKDPGCLNINYLPSHCLAQPVTYSGSGATTAAGFALSSTSFSMLPSELPCCTSFDCSLPSYLDDFDRKNFIMIPIKARLLSSQFGKFCRAQGGQMSTPRDEGLNIQLHMDT